MKIRKIWFVVALAIIAMHIGLFSGALAQEPVEAADVRGQFSNGNGIWSADDFGWFYYDLDKATGGERLQIDAQGRTAEKGHIVYSSRAWSRQFEYEPWGSYKVVAFLGKLYLAGYPDSSFADEVSSLGKGDLREVLRDEEKTYNLNYNRTLPLSQGYSLAAVETSEKNGVVDFILLKNGNPVYRSVVSIGDTFVYEVDDVPVLLVHLANAMKGEDNGFVEVDGIFQINDLPIAKLFEGGRLGNMKLEDLSDDGIEFRNSEDLTLKRDSTVPLTPNLVIVVLDQPELIYYPMGRIFDYGVHEIRGPVFNTSSQIPVKLGTYNSTVQARWNAMNYSGFYFDPAKSLGAETLVLYSVQDRRVSPPTNPTVYQENNTAFQKGFQYTSTLQAREFEFKPWGGYFVMSFLGMQWFAGYDSSVLGGRATKSLLEREYLGKVLMDTELQGIAFAGNYSLQEGYEMRIHDVGNDSIFLQLLKDGTPVESSVVKSNSTYIYKKDLGDVEDLPIIMVHLNNVFSNETRGFATIDAVFQISDQYIIPIERGNGIGEMQIVNVQPGVVVMVNDDYIDLNRDSNVAIGPVMNIRVADNDTLRYYPYTAAYVVPAPGQPQINKPDNITSRTPANFSMIEQAAEIRQVTAEIVDSMNRTIFIRDITNLGQGSGDIWLFTWKWNATTLQLSDDKSQIMDVGDSLVPGLLYLNQSTRPEQVGVFFDSSGRIGRIINSRSIYYVSRSEYGKLKVTMDYDTMQANETIRTQFLKIEPGKSILQFQDIIDGRLIPSGINHTLQGTLSVLEPHAIEVGAKPGRYELQVRIENAVNAIKAFDEFFNVTPAEMRGVYLGSAEVSAGEEVSIPIEAPSSGGEKRINLSYDASMVKAMSISGACNPTWQVDPDRGRISVLLPVNCSAANLTFAAEKANATIDINVTGLSGFVPESITNGSITVAADNGTAKSNALGFVATLAALAFIAYARRRG